jgi:hypothetical protein
LNSNLQLMTVQENYNSRDTHFHAREENGAQTRMALT